MRSVPEAVNALRALLLVVAFGACQAPAFSQHATPGPSRDEVQAAHDRVQKDPNLGGTKKEQKLHFKDFGAWDSKPTKSEPAAPWLVGLARWMAEAGRLVIWALGALAVALFLVGLRYWIRVRADAVAVKALRALPSHVRELDIRPESLPEQIGAAARALWQSGEHHAALSLLYRGALSRLVHDHAVPIRAASTEGECVQQAARRLSPSRGAFFGRLVAAWQLAVYGARLPEAAIVLALCDEFDAQLRPAPASPEATR